MGRQVGDGLVHALIVVGRAAIVVGWAAIVVGWAAGYVSFVSTLLIVAISVGLDNFGAATSVGVSGVDSRLRLRMALIFGTFEAVMPLVGLLVGRYVANDLGGSTKIVAGVVLGSVGAYEIASDLLGGPGADKRPRAKSLGGLLALGATLSIDNLAIGFALGSYHVDVAAAAFVIAIVSVALTLAGLEIGSRVGERLGRWSGLVGGLMLVGVGIAVGTGVL